MTQKQHIELSNRRHHKPLATDDYFHGKKRVFDADSGRYAVKIFSGEWYVSKEPEKEMLATILGSCVAACIRDPIAKVGGMNHFLLPGDETMVSTMSDAARYGVFAMESLINGILKAGGRKERLEVKVFGGGNVIKNSAKIGSKNALFIREFLAREGYHVFTSDLEGEYPRRIHYFADTGRVLMRKLRRKDDLAVVAEEKKYATTIASAPVEGAIDLF